MFQNEGMKLMVGNYFSFGDYFMDLSGCRGGFDTLGNPLDLFKGLDGLVVELGGSDDGEVVFFAAEGVCGSVVVGG